MNLDQFLFSFLSADAGAGYCEIHWKRASDSLAATITAAVAHVLFLHRSDYFHYTWSTFFFPILQPLIHLRDFFLNIFYSMLLIKSIAWKPKMLTTLFFFVGWLVIFSSPLIDCAAEDTSTYVERWKSVEQFSGWTDDTFRLLRHAFATPLEWRRFTTTTTTTSAVASNWYACAKLHKH